VLLQLAAGGAVGGGRGTVHAVDRVHDAVDALLGRQLENGREDLDRTVDLARAISVMARSARLPATSANAQSGFSDLVFTTRSVPLSVRETSAAPSGAWPTRPG